MRNRNLVVIPLDLGIKIDENEPVRKLIEICDDLDYTDLFAVYLRHWRKIDPRTMRLRDDRLCTIFNTSSGGYTWDDICNETNMGHEGCEGYYFYGYEDKVVARGRDFLAGKWIASAQFVVEY